MGDAPFAGDIGATLERTANNRAVVIATSADVLHGGAVALAFRQNGIVSSMDTFRVCQKCSRVIAAATKVVSESSDSNKQRLDEAIRSTSKQPYALELRCTLQYRAWSSEESPGVGRDFEP